MNSATRILGLYRVQGARALRDALDKGRADTSDSWRDLSEEWEKAPPEGKATLRRVFETAAKIGGICEVVTQVKNGADSAIGIGKDWLVPLLDHFSKGG